MRSGSPDLERWAIGSFAGPTPFHLAPVAVGANPGLTYLDIPPGPWGEPSFVADPFMVRGDEGWALFFELKCGKERPGVIAYATAGDDCLRWVFWGLALQEPFHLSYPHVFFWKGHHYMTPETGEADEVRLYRADPFPAVWKPVARLVRGRYVDPTPFRHDGRWWMFACSEPWKHDTLHLFHADRLTGPWRRHPSNPIISRNARLGRPAGRVICHDGALIRFAQDCHETYGRRVFALVVEELTTDTYSEREVALPVLAPARGRWPSQRAHHVDAHRLQDGRWLACVDGQNLPG